MPKDYNRFLQLFVYDIFQEKNAKTVSQITEIIFKLKGYTIHKDNGAYTTEFRNKKTTINRYMNVLLNNKMVKRKSVESDSPINAYVYWVDKVVTDENYN